MLHATYRRTTLMRLAPLALVALTAAACSTTVATVALGPDPVPVESPLAGTVRVEATGSPRRIGFGAPRITGASVAAAVRGAILDSGLATGVVESGAADHVLRIEVLDAQRSDLQLDMEAEVSARWTLLDGAGRVMRWQKQFTTEGKANTFDARLVEERAQMALEEAVRKNLEQGLTELGRLGVRATP